jgi:dihydropteroate synthase
MFEWSELCGDRPAVMGVLNVTPDSFSDGGRYFDVDAAVARGLELAEAGADVIDVGGESTRPGAEPVSEAEELRRVLPVVEQLASVADLVVSIDTTKAGVAAAALEAGAKVVNDVSAGRDDAAMLGMVAGSRAGYVVMHRLGDARTMQDDPSYDDVVEDVGAFLVQRLAAARAAGIAPGALAADPGIGFGKTLDHNLTLLARLDAIAARVEVPLVVGTSRKRFIGAVLRGVGGEPGEPAPDARDDGTLATVVWALDRGARVVRVHDARSAARTVRLFGVLRAATQHGVAV